MKQIALSGKSGQGKFALVDDEDFERLNQFKWYLSNTGYASTSGGRKLMHSLLMNTPPKMHTDHKDHNSLNNQKSNLRVCTCAQNVINQEKKSGLSSKYKGVCWDKINKKWESYFWLNDKKRKLGRFSSEEDAALAYNLAAFKHFGEFAVMNRMAI